MFTKSEAGFRQLLPLLKPHLRRLSWGAACMIVYVACWPILAWLAGKLIPEIGKGNLKIIPEDHLFITTGVMTQIAIQASEHLEQENNIKCGVIHMATVKPLDKEILFKLLFRFFIKEELPNKGILGSAIFFNI